MKPTRSRLLLSVSLLFALVSSVGAQVTFTDNFNTPVNYLTNGVTGTIWDGIYLGAGEIANPTSVGASAGTVSVADADISHPGTLTISSLQTDWENTADDGVFLFRLVSGDFDVSVQIIGPTDAGAYNLPGLMVRAYGTNGSPAPNNAENSIIWGRFEYLNHVNMQKNNVNGVKTDTVRGAPAPNTNYWLRITRVGNVFALYEKGSAPAAWNSVGTVTRADFNALPVQVGIEHSDYAGGATRSAQYANFSLTVSNMGPFAATPAAPTGLTLSSTTNTINASWTPGSGNMGSLIVAWTGDGTVKEAPPDGYDFTYTAQPFYGQGASLFGAGYYLVYFGPGTNATIKNVVAGVTYHVAVYSCSEAGALRTAAYSSMAAVGTITVGGAAPGALMAQAELDGTNVLITFNSSPPKWYIVQYSATLAPANWENLFAIPVQATNFFMSQLHLGGATNAQGYYRVAQFDSPPPGVNLALVASDLTSYVSPWETLTAINNGLDPANSADHSHGAYGNWAGNGGNGTQWIEYDFSQPVTTAKIDVYWWQDGAGVYDPAACRLKYWDGTNFVLVQNPVGLGVALNQYNTTTFSTVTSTKFRLEMDSDGTHSTGVLQWKIYDTGATPNFAPVVVGDIDRDVVTGDQTFLTGAVRDDGKLYVAPQISWSALPGPGSVTFSNATATNTSATLTGIGPNVIQLTAYDGQYQSSNTVNVNVQPPFATAHPLPLYVDKNTYTINSTLWNYRLSKNITNWIPHLYAELNDTNNPTGNINSFIQVSNRFAGVSYTVPSADPYADAYTLNTVEAMCYALNYNAQGDPGILTAQASFRTNLDHWIPIILSAQAPDGYMHTYNTLRGIARWSAVGNHEGYVGGYFIEAGLAHYLACERTNAILYNAAKKLADCWCANLGPGKKIWFDGHENMEQALVHLGRFVNEYEGPTNGNKYIDLAKWLIDCRGTPAANSAENDSATYDQSHLPVNHQYEIVGHAVRAEYLASGVADVALETGDLDYQSTAMSLWDNFVNKKYYLTGGAGSGATSEGFGDNYILPNTSYCETCAGCGTLFFFHKLNMAYQDARFADEMENVLYNEILGAVDDQALKIFYPNPLTGGTRAAWTGVPCCYGNFARTVLELPTWTYLRSSNSIYLNLFIGSTMNIPGVAGATVQIVQSTDYPWTNTDRITVNPSVPSTFTLYIRAPNRTISSLYTPTPAISGLTSVLLDGAPVSFTVTNGYAAITRTWTAGDYVDIVLPMAVQRIKASNKIAADQGLVALQYGPLIYNIESADQPTGLVLNPSATLSTRYTNILGGIVKITGNWSNGTNFIAIPNYSRLNRGGSSAVWFRDQ